MQILGYKLKNFDKPNVGVATYDQEGQMYSFSFPLNCQCICAQTKDKKKRKRPSFPSTADAIWLGICLLQEYFNGSFGYAVQQSRHLLKNSITDCLKYSFIQVTHQRQWLGDLREVTYQQWLMR